jgi:hypothetical protein
MNFVRFALFGLVLSICLPVGQAYAQDDLDFKRELLERARDLSETHGEFIRWELIQGAEILAAPDDHPKLSTLEEIRSGEYENEYERRVETTEYFSRCANSGVTARAISELKKMKLTHGGLFALTDSALACGFYGDSETFSDLLDHIQQLANKPYMAAKSTTNEQREAGEERDYKIVAKRLTPQQVKELRNNMHFLYRLGQVKSDMKADAWPEDLKDSNYPEVLKLHQAKALAESNNFQQSFQVANQISYPPLKDRAIVAIASSLKDSELELSEHKKWAKQIFDAYCSSDSSASERDLVGQFFHRLSNEEDPLFRRAFHKTDEALDYDWDVDLRSLGLLELSIEVGLAKTGLELLSNFERDDRRIEWLEDIYNRALKNGDGSILAGVVEQLTDKRSIFGRSYFSHQLEVTKVLAKSGNFEAAESYLSQIADEEIRKQASLLISAYRYNANDKAALLKTKAVQYFQTELRSAPVDPQQRARWVVYYTIETGWKRRSQSIEQAMKNGVLITLARNQILTEFEKVADANEAKKHVLTTLGSFTPPTLASRQILEDLLKLCPPEDPEANLPSQLTSLKERVQELADSANKSAKEKADIGAELLEKVAKALDASSEETDEDEVAELAYQFARMGNKAGVNRMIELITDKEKKGHILLDCFFVFPPVPEMLEVPSRSSTRLGGGVF